MRRRWAKVIAGLTAAALVAACSGGDGDGAAPEVTDEDGVVDPVTVVTAFYPLGWATEAVGGDRVAVTDLTPPGVDPHDLELTPDQRDDIEDAELVVVMGNGFQPAVEAAAQARSGATVVVFSELVSIDAEGREVADHDDEDDHGHDEVDLADTLDPHVWLDPVLMSEVVGVIEAALASVAPEDAETFAQGASDAVVALDELDVAYETALAECDTRLLVSAHGAFGYLANRYGLEPHGVAGLSPDAEPDAARLGELADLVEREGVQVVFTEEMVSPAIAETLASEAGVDTDVLSTLEGLTPESVDAGEDYLDVMRTNLDRIATGLGCT